MTGTSTTPPGWYPVDGNQERYWDGATWTTDTRPTPPGLGIGTPAPMIEEPNPGANALGLIALGAAVIGVAVIGVVFACIPGALIVGWVLPVAFILGIVGLFLSGKAKWPAVAAIILSVVGTIVAVVVFFAVLSAAAGEAFAAPAPSSSSRSNRRRPRFPHPRRPSKTTRPRASDLARTRPRSDPPSPATNGPSS